MPTKKTEIPIVLDRTTGLPELPEDHAWRIGDSIIEIVKHLPAGEWSAWSDVHLPPTDRLDIEHCNTQYSRKTGLLGRHTKVVTLDWWRFRKSASEAAIFAHHYGEWDYRWGWSDMLVVPDRITKANIVERTTEVYREWRASVSAEQEQEEIQGLYPPKTINEKGK